MTITLQLLDHTSARTTLPAPVWEHPQLVDSNQISLGVYRTGLYIQPRAKRVIERTYSLWATRDGCALGERYHELHPSDVARLCDAYPELESYAAEVEA